jgi:hypothetical protein
MKANGRTICNTALVLRYGLIKQNTKGSTNMVANMASEHITGQTVVIMKVNGHTTKFVGLALKCILVIKSTSESGQII